MVLKGGNRIKSKSGKWAARFRTLPDGAMVLDFCGDLSTEYKNVHIHIFENARERMAKLKILAREADSNQLKMTSWQMEQLNPWNCSVECIQGMQKNEYFQLMQHYEEKNFYNEIRFIQCLKAGRKDLAGVMAVIENNRRVENSTTPYNGFASYVVSRMLAGNFVNIEGCANDARLTNADTIKKATDLLNLILPVTEPDKLPPDEEIQMSNEAISKAKNSSIQDAHGHLIKNNGKSYGGTFAAKNIRIELKRHFPGVKFKVISNYSCVNVRWQDGPPTKNVEAILSKFKIGHSDTQSDYFYTRATAFSEIFGGVQYLFTKREYSDEFISESIEDFWAANFASVTNAPCKPNVNDWRKNTGFFEWHDDDWRARKFREYLEQKTKP